MNFQWAENSRPPKGIEADKVHGVLEKLPEPSPEALLEASKAKRHLLHDEFWSEGDQIWAQRGRLERARHIIASIHAVDIIGGKEITFRAFEFIRPNGEGRWAKIEDIRSDPDLVEAYMAEIIRLQEQASFKMEKLRELLRK